MYICMYILIIEFTNQKEFCSNMDILFMYVYVENYAFELWFDWIKWTVWWIIIHKNEKVVVEQRDFQ